MRGVNAAGVWTLNDDGSREFTWGATPLQHGDRVRVMYAGSLPLAMVGLEAEVVRINKTRVVLHFDSGRRDEPCHGSVLGILR